MSTPWVLASGVPGRWTGTYVHYDGGAEGLLSALEPVLVAFGGDLDAALEGMFSAPLGWRILGVDAFDSDDAEQQAWLATGRDTPGLAPADRVCLDHTATWAILDPKRRCVRLQQPGGDVFATHPIDDEGHIEGRPRRKAPDPAEILRRALARWPGGDLELHPELHEVFRFRTVVEVVSDPDREWTLTEAREVDPECALGDVLGELVTEAELED